MCFRKAFFAFVLPKHPLSLSYLQPVRLSFVAPRRPRGTKHWLFVSSLEGEASQPTTHFNSTTRGNAVHVRAASGPAIDEREPYPPVVFPSARDRRIVLDRLHALPCYEVQHLILGSRPRGQRCRKCARMMIAVKRRYLRSWQPR